jgi:hypothetical protein
LQNFNYTCLIKDAKANNLAYFIKKAKALNVKRIDSKNTIIVKTPIKGNIVKGSNFIKCSKSYISYINFITLCKKDKIKAKKANGAKSKE